MDNIIEVKNLVKTFGDFTAVNDISFNVKKGRDFRVPWAERRGKVDDDQDADDDPQSHERRHHAERPRPDGRRRRRAPLVRHRVPGPEPGRRPYRDREHESPRRALRRSEQSAQGTDRTAAEICGALGPARQSGKGIFRRHEAAARDRARASSIIQRYCSSTSRRSASIRRRAITCGAISKISTRPKASRCSSRRTIWKKPSASPSGSRSSTTGRSSRPAPRQELKSQTGTDSLEDAFLKLTGTVIRDEDASSTDRMRARSKDVARRATIRRS